MGETNCGADFSSADEMFDPSIITVWFNYSDETTHVVIDGEVFARCKSGSGALSGPLAKDADGGWYSSAPNFFFPGAD